MHLQILYAPFFPFASPQLSSSKVNSLIEQSASNSSPAHPNLDSISNPRDPFSSSTQ